MLGRIANSSGPFHSHINNNTVGLIAVCLPKIYLLSSLTMPALYFKPDKLKQNYFSHL